MSSERDWDKADTGWGVGWAGGGTLQLPCEALQPLPTTPAPSLYAKTRTTHSVIESFGVYSWGTIRLEETETCLTVF